jgi:diadenylate cyclase
MAENLRTFAYQLSYLLTHVTAADIVDMVLVAAVFFVIFQVLRQTRALQVLRGAIIVAILGAVLLVLLPLKTFSLLLRGLLLAGAIALPFIFHDELRRLLSGLGRFGRRPQGLGPAAEQMKETLVSAVTQLASRREGALIVLEGATPLADIAATGIPVHAEQVTAELLTTIFHPRTPLHDGAVIIREGTLVAAGCLLPVQTPEARYTHLGMRHRAALGLTSEIPDAMVIAVSEETGRISVAQGGRLHQGLSQAQLETRLDRFQGMVEQPRSAGGDIANGRDGAGAGLSHLDQRYLPSESAATGDDSERAPGGSGTPRRADDRWRCAEIGYRARTDDDRSLE